MAQVCGRAKRVGINLEIHRVILIYLIVHMRYV
jgi:hypothetical protein